MRCEIADLGRERMEFGKNGQEWERRELGDIGMMDW